MNIMPSTATAANTKWAKCSGLLRVGFLTCLLVSCQSTTQHKTLDTAVMDDLQQVMTSSVASSQGNRNPGAPSNEVLEALVPGLSLEAAAMQPVEERFDFAVRQPLDVKEF